MTRTRLILSAALIAVSSAALVGEAAAATKHRHHVRGWQSAPVQLSQPGVFAPSYRGYTSGRYSGPFRTDSAPLTGGGY